MLRRVSGAYSGGKLRNRRSGIAAIPGALAGKVSGFGDTAAVALSAGLAGWVTGAGSSLAALSTGVSSAALSGVVPGAGALTGTLTVTTAGSYSAEATAYFAAMTVQPDAAQKTRINTFIVALKDAGVWPAVSMCHLLAGHHEQASRVDAFLPSRIAAAVNSPAFVVNRGWTCDGVGMYLDLAANAVGTGKFVQNSAFVYEYVLSGTAQGRSATGTISGTASNNRVWASVPASGSNETFRINDETGDILRAATGSVAGGRCLVREGAAIKRGYFNGTLVADLTTASTGNTSGNFAINRRSAVYSDAVVGVRLSGSALTAAQVAALHTATTNYLTSIGAI